MGNSTNRLRPEVIEDLTDTTHLSEEEVRRWYKEFQKDFPSGQVTIEQFKKIYTQHFPSGDAGKFAEHVFRTFDKDNDHVLDFREFLVAFSISSSKDPKERLAWAFSMYDIDENGYITKAECSEIVKSLCRLIGARIKISSLNKTPEQRVDHLFEVMDLDQDGRVTFEEFVNAAHADPEVLSIIQADAN